MLSFFTVPNFRFRLSPKPYSLQKKPPRIEEDVFPTRSPKSSRHFLTSFRSCSPTSRNCFPTLSTFQTRARRAEGSNILKLSIAMHGCLKTISLRLGIGRDGTSRSYHQYTKVTRHPRSRNLLLLFPDVHSKFPNALSGQSEDYFPRQPLRTNGNAPIIPRKSRLKHNFWLCFIWRSVHRYVAVGYSLSWTTPLYSEQLQKGVLPLMS